MTRLLALLLMLFSSSVWGADGDDAGPSRRGGGFSITAVLLCDGKAAADEGNNCGMYSATPELPDIYHFFVPKDDGCTAYSVNVQTFFETSSDGFTVCTLTNTNSECYILTEFDGALEHNFRVALTTLTDCTDLDVVGEFTVYDKP